MALIASDRSIALSKAAGKKEADERVGGPCIGNVGFPHPTHAVLIRHAPGAPRNLCRSRARWVRL